MQQLSATRVMLYCQGRLLPGGRGGAGPGRRVPPPRGGRLPLPGPGHCAGRPVGGGQAGAGAAGAGGGAALGGGRGAAGDPPRPRGRGAQLPALRLPLHLPVPAGQGPVRGETQPPGHPHHPHHPLARCGTCTWPRPAPARPRARGCSPRPRWGRAAWWRSSTGCGSAWWRAHATPGPGQTTGGRPTLS